MKTLKYAINLALKLKQYNKPASPFFYAFYNRWKTKTASSSSFYSPTSRLFELGPLLWRWIVSGRAD